MPTPPIKCLRGVITVPAAVASQLSTAQQIPTTVFLDNNFIGIQWTVAIQLLNGNWVDISTNSTLPGVSDGEAYFGIAIDNAVQEINQMGIKQWILGKAQTWASANIYGYFSPLINGAGSDPITANNFREKVNAALDDMFILLDTNGDGMPEFHGK